MHERHMHDPSCLPYACTLYYAMRFYTIGTTMRYVLRIHVCLMQVRRKYARRMHISSKHVSRKHIHHKHVHRIHVAVLLLMQTF
jgi:hypothetical protein